MKVKEILVKLEGGLGNQLYQYATARSLAKRFSCKLKLIERLDSKGDQRRHNHIGLFTHEAELVQGFEWVIVRLLLIDKFKLGRKLRKSIPPFTNYKFVIDPQNGYIPHLLEAESGSVILCGYWQSYKYFQTISNLIRKELSFKSAVEGKQNVEYLRKIHETNSVALHIRRGDYVTVGFFRENFGTCSLEYYRDAINEINKQVVDCEFYIFSDDPDWVRDNLKVDSPHHYITHNVGMRDYEDFRLMMNCKHFIIANSSFSWWAAYLSSYPDKIVMSPRIWFKDDSMPFDDRIPYEWQKIRSS